MGAEGIAVYKPGVCEAKHGKHKLLTTRACNKLWEPRGKALKLYGGLRDEHYTNRS